MCLRRCGTVYYEPRGTGDGYEQLRNSIHPLFTKEEAQYMWSKATSFLCLPTLGRDKDEVS